MNTGRRITLSKFAVGILVITVGLGGSYAMAATTDAAQKLTYAVVDTNQTECLGIHDSLETCPVPGEKAYGQDSQYSGFKPDYTEHANGTVTDNNTRLIWANSIDINGDGQITVADKMSYDEAAVYAKTLTLAGYSDWRVPTIKELYSLMMFDGEDPSGLNGVKGEVSIMPFINHKYFGFDSGDTKAGERLIDSQYLSSTKYASTTMKGDETVFGVNFIDGRIKGYGMKSPRGNGAKKFYVLLVRGNTDYGINNFANNQNGSVTDKATGLIWQQEDSGMAMNWPSALSYCENLSAAGRNDWRLPNAKELHSIVDYTRSPDTTGSAAIDKVFKATSIVNEAGKLDYANYWSSTTHKNLRNSKNAVYVSFGRSLGYMGYNWMDVHGAGSQRSDPKVSNGQDYSQGHGPQGDAVRTNNYVRCVSDDNTQFVQQPKAETRKSKTYTLTGNESGGGKMTGKSTGSKSQLPDMGRGQKGPASGNNLISMMDRNGDGKLSKSEVKGPLARDFDRFDRNGDGFLVASEIPEPPGGAKRR